MIEEDKTTVFENELKAVASQPGNVISIDEGVIRQHLDRMVVRTVEETLNALLDAEADRLCGARRYERSPDRVDTRAGHYERQLHTKAGEVTLQVPKLRKLPFESAIIERYKRREVSVGGGVGRDVPCGCVRTPCGRHH